MLAGSSSLTILNRIVLSIQTPSALTAVHTVQECFRDVKAWVTANKLKLNDEKTEAIICDSKASQLNDSVDSIHIGQSVIPLSDTVRDLGLFLDKKIY